MEYDWAQIVSPGKQNERGKVEFEVKFTDDTTAWLGCAMMQGMHEMLSFMELNEIIDEEEPPSEWRDAMKRSKYAPEKALQTVEEKESIFDVGTRVYAEYVDDRSVNFGKFWLLVSTTYVMRSRIDW